MTQGVSECLNQAALTEPCQTQRQGFVGNMRGCAIGSENLVPHRQAEAEIAVTLIFGAGMMEAVHVGRHKKCLQAGIPSTEI